MEAEGPAALDQLQRVKRTDLVGDAAERGQGAGVRGNVGRCIAAGRQAGLKTVRRTPDSARNRRRRSVGIDRRLAEQPQAA